MKRTEVLAIYATLEAIKGALELPLHRFRAAAMRRQLRDSVEAIQETIKDLERFSPTVFNEKRIALATAASLKDEKGEPVIAGNQFQIDPAKKAEFEAVVGALKTEHQAAIDTYDAEVKKLNAFLMEEAEVPAIAIRFPLSWFNKTVDQSWLETLFPFIVDDSTEVAAK